MIFLLLKAFHIIAVVCWFAGLFYLPRLFVYHAMSEDRPSKERFKIMEHKLYYGIMTPSAILTIFFGGWMVIRNPAYLQSFWMQSKLGLVLLLIVYHVFCGYFVKQFAKDKKLLSHVFFRWFNEVPVLFLISMVILAVLKPL